MALQSFVWMEELDRRPCDLPASSIVTAIAGHWTDLLGRQRTASARACTTRARPA